MSEIARKLRDEILLIKIKRGDKQAFAEMYDAYVDSLYRFVLYRVETTEIAEDIISELFLRVWQYLTREEAQVKNIRAYLYQSSRNLITDHFRIKESDISLDDITEGGEPEAESENLEQKFNLQEIESALKKIKPESREVIVLAHIEGMSHQEIGEILNKTPAATRVMLHRALGELRKVLGVGQRLS